jgi:hypothetical protein
MLLHLHIIGPDKRIKVNDVEHAKKLIARLRKIEEEQDKYLFDDVCLEKDGVKGRCACKLLRDSDGLRFK